MKFSGVVAISKSPQLIVMARFWLAGCATVCVRCDTVCLSEPHVSLVAVSGSEIVQVGGSRLRAAFLMLRDNVEQSRLHVPRHVLRVPADIEMGARLEQPPHGPSLLAQAVLHVDLVGCLSAEGRAQLDGPRLVPAFQEVAVQEVLVPPPASEEQHRLPGRGPRLTRRQQAVLDECPEGRQPGAWPDHDDGRLRAGGQPEVRVLGGVNRHSVAHLRALAKVCGGHAHAVLVQSAVANDGHRDLDAPLGLQRGAADGVQARLQGAQTRQERRQRELG
mmetsp:Transcript_47425/g.121059  ORF Transcript_47425/g.121059 Transcript_47425/m.121059 type:complete len:276 (+) Transcript_47425:128-955(+)